MKFARLFLKFAVAGVLAVPAYADEGVVHPFDTSRPSAAELPVEVVTWRTGHDERGYFITNAEKKIYVRSAKRAERMVKRFNRAVSKPDQLPANRK